MQSEENTLNATSFNDSIKSFLGITEWSKAEAKSYLSRNKTPLAIGFAGTLVGTYFLLEFLGTIPMSPVLTALVGTGHLSAISAFATILFVITVIAVSLNYALNEKALLGNLGKSGLKQALNSLGLDKDQQKDIEKNINQFNIFNEIVSKISVNSKEGSDHDEVTLFGYSLDKSFSFSGVVAAANNTEEVAKQQKAEAINFIEKFSKIIADVFSKDEEDDGTYKLNLGEDNGPKLKETALNHLIREASKKAIANHSKANEQDDDSAKPTTKSS